MANRPGGELAKRPLHFIFILECSGSMTYEGKIQSLNHAIREAIPHMKDVAEGNPNAELLVRAIKFSSGAEWHISQPTPVDNFAWADVSAIGVTDMGRAFSMVADQLKIPPMTDRALPPVLVLISDGQPTDDYSTGLDAIMKQPWGKKSVRIAIAIGRDADNEVLQKFIGHSELKPLQADNADALVKYIRWVSTAVVGAASSPPSQTNATMSPGINIPIPAPPTIDASNLTPGDVW
jgi:uncharacterized protein YegL